MKSGQLSFPFFVVLFFLLTVPFLFIAFNEYQAGNLWKSAGHIFIVVLGAISTVRAYLQEKRKSILRS